MAFIPIPNGVRVCMRYNKDGQMVCNVFHVKVPSANPTTADLQAVGDVFLEWWNNTLQAAMPGAVTLEAIEVRDASAQGAEGIDVVVQEAGSVALATMPNNVTAAIKLMTGFAGRSFRGRSFFPAIASAWLSGQNTLSAATITLLQETYEELISLLIAEGFNLAIASLFSNGAPRATGILTEVANASVNATVDSQRRRLPERGA